MCRGAMSSVTQGLDGARRSVIGDSPQLLTHYYDDARTMYEVFRRGFSISGESTAVGRLRACGRPQKCRDLMRV